jgi:HlyD family secretion protein
VRPPRRQYQRSREGVHESMIASKSMVPSKRKLAALRAVAVVALAVLAARAGAQDAGRARRGETADDKRWQTVAPGRVEPSSGAIKITAPVMDVIAQVLVKVNDKVFAGEPLIRLTDNEARARLVEAQAALDKASIDRRDGRGSDVDREAALTALSQAQERLKRQKAELRRIEADASTPRPNVADGQVNVARAELAAAAAAIGKLTIRAPLAGTVYIRGAYRRVWVCY